MSPAPAPLAPFDDKVRQEQLDRMKRRATGLLVVATVVFAVTRVLESRYPWLGWIRATAEASMVGGLADWFAVTALFRHPLGIPIPHTAIIPARKDRVGRTLAAFVQRNFLSREVIGAKLRSLDIAAGLARWIAEPANAELIARHTATGLARGAELLRDEDVQDMIDRTLVDRIHKTKVAPLLGNVLSLVTADDRHQELLDEAIKLIAKGVSENKEYIRHRIEAESPWWVPTSVDDKIHQKILAGVERTLTEVRDDPRHPLRERFDAALRRFIDNLHHSPEVQTRAEALKEEFLDAAAVRRFSSALWVDAKASLLRYAENPEAYKPGMIERGLNAFGEAALADPKLLEKLDGWITDVALLVVERYQDEVGQLISQTVAAWDPYATSHRIELAIGRDLQFIRINGTLVGGAVGLLLYGIGKLFH
jgi:uncharacterized membrane-anchored protein YjiN (DUF445 family)